mgnify:CR=1 FL=1
MKQLLHCARSYCKKTASRVSRLNNRSDRCVVLLNE